MFCVFMQLTEASNFGLRMGCREGHPKTVLWLSTSDANCRTDFCEAVQYNNRQYIKRRKLPDLVIAEL